MFTKASTNARIVRKGEWYPNWQYSMVHRQEADSLQQTHLNPTLGALLLAKSQFAYYLTYILDIELVCVERAQVVQHLTLILSVERLSYIALLHLWSSQALQDLYLDTPQVLRTLPLPPITGPSISGSATWAFD